MHDIFTMLDGIIKGPGERLASDAVNGLVISTVFTTDLEVYETAIQDASGLFYPVQRYADKAEAIEGHKSWCDKSASLTEIVRLGFGNSISNKTIVLQREQ
jgi:hypothetical protein